uniref:Uncharacterized protein n=1 Tax=Populus trichocarpa TaxID=3694 RepID=A0A2K1Y934_POPTR
MDVWIWKNTGRQGILCLLAVEKIEWESPPSIMVTRNPNWSQRSGTETDCAKGSCCRWRCCWEERWRRLWRCNRFLLLFLTVQGLLPMTGRTAAAGSGSGVALVVAMRAAAAPMVAEWRCWMVVAEGHGGERGAAAGNPKRMILFSNFGPETPPSVSASL